MIYEKIDLTTSANRMIHYFAFGVNCSPEIMRILLGRSPKGIDAILLDYELCIQKWDELPRKVQKVLTSVWSPKFTGYFVRPRKYKTVSGKIWIITKKERELIKQWEFWYTPVHVLTKRNGDSLIRAETEQLRNYMIGRVINGEKYPLFPNGKSKHLQVARWFRRMYKLGL